MLGCYSRCCCCRCVAVAVNRNRLPESERELVSPRRSAVFRIAFLAHAPRAAPAPAPAPSSAAAAASSSAAAAAVTAAAAAASAAVCCCCSLLLRLPMSLQDPCFALALGERLFVIFENMFL